MEQKTNETASTRRLALKWWSDESNLLNRTALFNRYFSNIATKDKMFTVANNYEELTGREIEEIYNKEVLEPKRQKEWQEFQVNCRYSKPNQKQSPADEIIELVGEDNFKQIIKESDKRVNQKQFKQFDESLFKAYIDKLPESESLNMIKIIYENKLPDCKFKSYLDKWFKL